MKQLSRPLLGIFNFVCIVLALYMTTLQIIIYLKNEDSSGSSFQRFSENSEDMSPIYTFCLQDNGRGNMYTNGLTNHFDCNLLDFKVENNKFIITSHETCLPIEPEAGPLPSFIQSSFLPFQSSNITLPIGPLPSVIQSSFLPFQSSNITLPLQSSSQRRKRKVKCNFTEKNFGRIYNTYHLYQADRFIVWKEANKTLGISPRHYKEILMGLDYDYHFKTAAFAHVVSECKTIQYSIKDVSNVIFDDNLIHLRNYLQDYQMQTIDGTVLGWNDDAYSRFESSCHLRTIFRDEGCEAEDSFKLQLQNREKTPFPFKKVYQDPTKMCFSPILHPRRYRKKDQFTLDLNQFETDFFPDGMAGKSPVLSIHVHMKGQFIRSIGKEIDSLTAQDVTRYCPKLSGDYRDICYGTHLNYDISEVTVIQNRPDANKPCNPTLHDEDNEIIEWIVNYRGVNCIPVFWIGIKNFSSNLLQCSTQSQYNTIRKLTSNFTSFETFRKRYESPCQEMSIVTNSQRDQGRKEQRKFLEGSEVEKLYLDFQFRHVNDVYQKITNTREFTVENCWAGVGGFIGIFVGVSLMQVPQILIECYRYFCGKSNEIKSRAKSNNIPEF